jgi:hypothetical protein
MSNAKSITCQYPQVTNTNYIDDKISHELSKPESTPFIFTFSNLDKEIGQLSYLDSTKTITNVVIGKLSDNDERFIYIEGGSENYFTTHTIFKKTGVAIYTKTVSIFGIPSGTLAMGNCVGY